MFYFYDDFRQTALWVLALTLPGPSIGVSFIRSALYSTAAEHLLSLNHSASTLDGGRISNLSYYHREQHRAACQFSDPVIRALKGLVINYGEGGATKWENRGSETFCAPPSRQGKTFHAPHFQEWKLFVPPLQYG